MQKAAPPTLARPRRIYLQVRDLLAWRIAEEEKGWTVGSIIPNEADLGRSLGVSAGTARRALDAMETEQLVRRRPGRGTVVINREPLAVCPTCKQAIRPQGEE